MEVGKRLAVFSIKKSQKGSSIWTRAGYAVVNNDRSIGVYLDVLPIDGNLHVREAGEKRDVVVPQISAATPGDGANQSMGGL
ncbi:MAG: hypothetical protein K1X64_13010 [Myxococcaceae bacterium]|nr:hypothetical protein [Myxococcaceae bacterium]